MPIRIRHVAVLALFAASAVTQPAVAQDASAEPAPAPPAIEIVNDGGVAETWREQGGEFAAYGPDGEAVKPTPEAQALQALNASYDVQFVALQPTGVHSAPTPDDAAHPGLTCDGDGECIDGNAVVGRVPVTSAAQNALARRILGDWMRETGGPWSACAPEYHHALVFSADGHAWEVLLCYGCGHYAIRRDGVQVAAAESEDKTGLAEFNDLLSAAGVPAWDSESRKWQAPATD